MSCARFDITDMHTLHIQSRREVLGKVHESRQPGILDLRKK